MTRAVSLSRSARNLVFVRGRYRKRHEVYADYESQALKADAPEGAVFRIGCVIACLRQLWRDTIPYHTGSDCPEVLDASSTGSKNQQGSRRQQRHDGT